MSEPQLHRDTYTGFRRWSHLTPSRCLAALFIAVCMLYGPKGFRYTTWVDVLWVGRFDDHGQITGFGTIEGKPCAFRLAPVAKTK